MRVKEAMKVKVKGNYHVYYIYIIFVIKNFIYYNIFLILYLLLY